MSTTTPWQPESSASWDPAAPPTPPPTGDAGRVGLSVDPPGRQRRWTVLLRAFLLIPIIVWTVAVGFVTAVVLVYVWFAVLFTGRRPSGPTELVRGLLHLTVRYLSYLMLMTDVFPPLALSARAYPVRLVLPEDGPGSRLSVLFRAFLLIPAVLVSNLLTTGWAFLSPACWIWTLITGRTPRTFHRANVAVLRWQMRTQAYATLMTGRWPRRLFGDAADAFADAEPGPSPDGYSASYPTGASDGTAAEHRDGALRLGTPATILLIAYLLIGVAQLGSSIHRQVEPSSSLVGSAAGTPPGQAAPAPDAATTELLSHVPANLQASCRTVADAVNDSVDNPQEITALSCPVQRPGQLPITLIYRLYPDPAGAQAPYGRFMGSTVMGDNNHCGQGQPGAGDWLNEDNSVAGSLVCGTVPAGANTPGSAYVFWTEPSAHLTAEIDLTQPDLTQLFAFWMTQRLTL